MPAVDSGLAGRMDIRLIAQVACSTILAVLATHGACQGEPPLVLCIGADLPTVQCA